MQAKVKISKHDLKSMYLYLAVSPTQGSTVNCCNQQVHMRDTIDNLKVSTNALIECT